MPQKRYWLIQKRLEKGFKTAHSFSEAIGLSKNYYREIERGEKHGSPKTLHKIAQKLEFNIEEFFREGN